MKNAHEILHYAWSRCKPCSTAEGPEGTIVEMQEVAIRSVWSKSSATKQSQKKSKAAVSEILVLDCCGQSKCHLTQPPGQGIPNSKCCQLQAGTQEMQWFIHISTCTPRLLGEGYLSMQSLHKDQCQQLLLRIQTHIMAIMRVFLNMVSFFCWYRQHKIFLSVRP